MENRTPCKEELHKTILNQKAKKKTCHLELTRMIEIVEIRFNFDRVIEILQELSLKCHYFLDIAKQGVDFGIR